MTMPPEAFDDQSEIDLPPRETQDVLAHEFSEQPAVQVDESMVEPPQPSPGHSVEEMTIAELIGQFFRAPGHTVAALLKVLNAPPDMAVSGLTISKTLAQPERSSLGAVLNFTNKVVPARELTPEQISARQREGVQLGMRLGAVVIAWYGSTILATERIIQLGLDVGAPYLLLAFIVWLLAELYGSWPSLVTWGRNFGSQDVENHNQTDDELDRDEIVEDDSRPWWMRLALVGMGVAFSALAAVLNSNNQFSIPGIIAWMVSISVWVAALAPTTWNVNAFREAIGRIRFHRNWTFWTLVLIMLVGAYFRLNQLSTIPSEMTSDHVEKLLDAQRILDGETQVFFPNNGGRDPMQFYLLASMARVFGLQLNFLTLKILTVIEGLISIPLLWWMGREVIGKDDRKLGNIVGLILAALVAVSYWHVALSRLGLRIILTVVFTALLVICLSRALRYNRRGDYIKAGLVLGFGLYAYQAVRMLPVVIVVGVGLAVLFRLIANWSVRKRGDGQTARYIINLIVLAAMALAVFVPLLTFSLQYPNDFWRRTSGRLLGDDLIQTRDENGNIVQRVATLEERLEAFQKNRPILEDNIRNALLMYHWKGDVAWINAAPNRPALDVFTGALLIVGLAAWLARMIRRRDAVDWLMPIMLFIMLLPSALSIAYPVENPSATRTSGTLPEAYLFAAFPLALIVAQIIRIAPRRGAVVAAGLAGIIIFSAYNANQNVYFGEYALYYTGSALPYSDAGKALKGFAESGGSYGNAYMIAYPYWWDHRAIGIEAGLIDWPNGIITLKDTPGFLYMASQKSDRYRLDPDRDLLFFYSTEDSETEQQLKEWFPGGYAYVFPSYQPEDNFKLYRVPALGSAAFIDFLVRTGAAQ
jgi:hypothetical protein